MSKQALDISQMQHLKELGIDTSSGSAFWYRIIQNKVDGNIRVISDWKLTFSLDIAYCTGHTLESMKTFTLQDILDLLPNLIESQDEGNNYWLEFGTAMEDSEWWYIRYMSVYGVKLNYEEDEHLIDAAYEMLCWCIENGYVKTNKED